MLYLYIACTVLDKHYKKYFASLCPGECIQEMYGRKIWSCPQSSVDGKSFWYDDISIKITLLIPKGKLRKVVLCAAYILGFTAYITVCVSNVCACRHLHADFHFSSNSLMYCPKLMSKRVYLLDCQSFLSFMFVLTGLALCEL